MLHTCRFSVVRFRFYQSQRIQDWISPILPSVSLPYLLSNFLTGGNRGNGELKTWSDGEPAVPNKHRLLTSCKKIFFSIYSRNEQAEKNYGYHKLLFNPIFGNDNIRGVIKPDNQQLTKIMFTNFSNRQFSSIRIISGHIFRNIFKLSGGYFFINNLLVSQLFSSYDFTRTRVNPQPHRRLLYSDRVTTQVFGFNFEHIDQSKHR